VCVFAGFSCSGTKGKQQRLAIPVMLYTMDEDKKCKNRNLLTKTAISAFQFFM
jgi:hypothetical protein